MLASIQRRESLYPQILLNLIGRKPDACKVCAYSIRLTRKSMQIATHDLDHETGWFTKPRSRASPCIGLAVPQRFPVAQRPERHAQETSENPKNSDESVRPHCYTSVIEAVHLNSIPIKISSQD